MAAKPPFPSQQQDRFIVRLPDGMRDRIAEAAKANNRSMNAEIVARLASTLEDRDTFTSAMKLLEQATTDIKAIVERAHTDAAYWNAVVKPGLAERGEDAAPRTKPKRRAS